MIKKLVSLNEEQIDIYLLRRVLGRYLRSDEHSYVVGSFLTQENPNDIDIIIISNRYFKQHLKTCLIKDFNRVGFSSIDLMIFTEEQILSEYEVGFRVAIINGCPLVPKKRVTQYDAALTMLSFQRKLLKNIFRFIPLSPDNNDQSEPFLNQIVRVYDLNKWMKTVKKTFKFLDISAPNSILSAIQKIGFLWPTLNENREPCYRFSDIVQNLRQTFYALESCRIGRECQAQNHFELGVEYSDVIPDQIKSLLLRDAPFPSFTVLDKAIKKAVDAHDQSKAVHLEIMYLMIPTLLTPEKHPETYIKLSYWFQNRSLLSCVKPNSQNNYYEVIQNINRFLSKRIR
ncbi:hypothetical protein DID75_03000 [Candidatus Marinamargulisbacteria bacterium SCGC AG-410-N11]|nr:hypothetical protein DID75_03000 [Candidatus Marinamargulisbacteria bacterium SCGC AG-410-N11]